MSIGGRRAMLAGAAALLLAACATPAAAPSTLTVFAASSLQDAFRELGAQFEAREPGVAVVFNFAGSQQLAQQLVQGAPADVFASASAVQIDLLAQAKAISATAAMPIARNRLVLITPADNPGRITALNDLASGRRRIVLAAKEVPAGAASLDVLERAGALPGYGAGFRERVLASVASHEENVRVVLGKVALGEADAGLVYRSDALSAGAKVAIIELPAGLSPPIAYPAVVLRDARQAELGARFLAFVRSDAGRAVLQKHGFEAP